MLQIKNISKKYKTGGFEQRALDGVSLNLRDNEFVAILGPSGSGKTTFLNIIGGLDRYDDGDLIINGVSTKKYRDRDWDSYRNHMIGFVFQNYNLIMHQTVLANVELALTISGISGAERRKRAEAALEKVGLGAHMHKKPNQMSGGQMQRVAIARALVNDPDIVLADEPTGALDSETSVQVMDLLKEVAKDRLVVMVTHNPDLAKEYATRIVNISDGHIVSDTDPYVVDEADIAPAVHRNLGHASMSFLTALALSFNNLKTKKARTILVAFAGSIGIIGIALILSLSNGVNRYIKNEEAQTLAQYPLQIEQTGFDFSSMMMGSMMGGSTGSSGEDIPEGKVGVQEFLTDMVTDVSVNDLTSLRTYLQSGESNITDYTTAIEYRYDITPRIYRVDRVPVTDNNTAAKADTDNVGTTSGGEGDAAKESAAAETKTEYVQINPNTVFSTLKLGQTMFSSMMSTAMNSNMFYVMPEEQSLYDDNYEVLAGHWPENDHQMILVLTPEGEVSDVLLYDLGLRDDAQLEKVMDTKETGSADASADSGAGSVSADSSADSGAESVTADSSADSGAESVTADSTGSAAEKAAAENKSLYDYDEFLGMTFKMVKSSDFYVYDEEYKVWTDRSNDNALAAKLAAAGEDLEIVGIVKPKSANGGLLTAGINYPSSLTQYIMRANADSDVVKAQQKTPEVNVLTGERFDAESDSGTPDLSKLFSFNTDAFEKAFSAEDMSLDDLDMSSLSDAFSGMDFSNLDLGSAIDPNALSSVMPSLSEADITKMLEGVEITATEEDVRAMFEKLLSGYSAYSSKDPSTDYSKLGSSISEYLASSDASAIMQEQIGKIIEANSENLITEDDIVGLLTDVMSGFSEYVEANELDPADYANNLQLYLNDAGTRQKIAAGIAALTEKISNIQVTEDQLTELASALSGGYTSYASANGLPDPSRMGDSFAGYLQTDEAKSLLLDSAGKMVNTDKLQQNLSDTMSRLMGAVAQALGTQIGNALTSAMSQVGTQLESAMTQAMTSVMTQMGSNLGSMFDIDPDSFADAIKLNMTAEEIESLLGSLVSGSRSATVDSNLASFGYADEAKPIEIDIYPKDFDAKANVVSILDQYNADAEAAGEEERVISYTDMVATMMSSVTSIIDTISMVLIAFVAISLIVSSIMIGVITYISVLERRKEIGILRAIGASKRNIAQVFNAETFITGLLAGLIGVGMTMLLLIPVNAIIAILVKDMVIHAMLPVPAALLLIGLSILLTLISGLLPASKASKSDPVAALRTE